MKRLLSLLLVGVLVITLTCCGEQQSPTETAEIFLDSLKTIDLDTTASVYDSSSSENFLPEVNDKTEKIINRVKKGEIFKLFKFDYKIVDEHREGDKATVDIQVKTYDLESAFASFMDKFIPYALTSQYSQLSKDDKLMELINFADKEAAKVKTKDFTNSATLELVKADGQWKVTNVDENSDFIHAISGGLSDLVTELSNIL